LLLCRAPGIGSATVRRLLDEFPDVEAVLSASPAALRAAGLGSRQIDALRKPDEAAIATDLQWLTQDNCHLLTCTDPAFPSRLQQIPQAPALLFVQGDPEVLSMPQLAIVGARNASPQGLENAEAFAAELARGGFIVTSGLALGIDGAAHRGAMTTGYTIAVCGTGLDRVYPARHRALAHQIVDGGGALVSEYPCGVAALAENFPRRNRIISGLTLGVLVVEAARESGSLITARYALEQGREVFAIPGSIHNPMARGCHALIRQGAKLVETVQDLFEELAPALGTQRATDNRQVNRSDPADDGVLGALDDAPQTADQLAHRVGRPVGELQVALTTLELQGQVAMTADGRYQRLRRN
jgi:DNA processing protein